MSKKRAEIIRQTHDELHHAEAAIETALIAVADLTSSLARKRIDANVSMVVGTEAMQAMIETVSVLGTARTTIARAHTHRSDVQLRLGYRTIAGGTGTDKGTETTPGVPPVPKAVANDERLAG
jgi:hypothetical protein